MAEMLASSLLWRVLLAIGGWFSALAHSSRIFAWLGRTWRASKTRAWLLRRLSASDAPTRESWSAKRFARLNARLAARHGLKDCLDDSVLCLHLAAFSFAAARTAVCFRGCSLTDCMA